MLLSKPPLFSPSVPLPTLSSCDPCLDLLHTAVHASKGHPEYNLASGFDVDLPFVISFKGVSTGYIDGFANKQPEVYSINSEVTQCVWVVRMMISESM